MLKNKTLLLLFGILIIATFLRLYHFTTTPPGLYPDEAIDGNDAAMVANTGQFQVFYTADNGREGLFVNIVAILLKFTGIHEPWIIRLPSAIAGILTVLGLYFLIAKLFGTEIGLLAAFFLATSFWHINFSRIGFRAILAPLCLVWSSYFFLKSLEVEKRFRKLGLWAIYSLAAGVIYAAGFYTYIAYRITPLLFLLFVPFFKKYPGFWKRASIFIAITFIFCLPIGYYFLIHPADFFGRTSQISVSNSPSPIKDLGINVLKTALMFNFRGDSNWRHNISGAPELFWPIGILFILGIFLGASFLLKKRRSHKVSPETTILYFSWLFTFLWFLLAWLPVVVSDEGIPHALRSILLLPPAMTFAAIGGIKLHEFIAKIQFKKTLKIAVCFFLAAIAVSAYMQYFVVWADNPNVAGAFNNDYVQIGRKINALPTSTPKYVVVEANGVLVNGIPMPAQTVMFITDTYSSENQNLKNIKYILPNEETSIPAGASVFYIK
ncbi:MAG: glycosyltransferase family 39 protein [Patescibacteria group bacterium]|nr:glycosyltransferase family 39 protein [Patescibacteria group bacterium]MDE2015815.1 glycosyltransferase family 39 protein [Patescibacteria group bacterium]MDE2227190.1 glycosyltransferase family 39 protein [Patescibacteria group bacterium]